MCVVDEHAGAALRTPVGDTLSQDTWAGVLLSDGVGAAHRSRARRPAADADAAAEPLPAPLRRPPR